MIPIRDDNPTTLTPVITVSLIVCCVLVFLWQISHGEDAQQLIVYALGVIPAVLFEGAILPEEIAWIPPTLTVFTSMFLHGGWGHLLGNMLYLWIFGNNIEDAMGHLRFILFYLLCGVAAVLAQALPDTGSEIPMVGASGAISGVLGAYLLLHPHARVLVVIPIGFIIQTIQLRAVWVLGLWFGIQLLSSALATSGEGGVAFGAHIGGFIAGMTLIPFFKHRNITLQNPFGPDPGRR
jgi:membrane associated rhomboid family serine protease